MRRLVFALSVFLPWSAGGRVARAQAPAPPALEQPDETSPLRTLYKKAQLAFEGGDLQQARGLFLQAYAISPRAEVALGLGQVEFELKRYRDAAEHLDSALRNLGPAVSEAVFERAKKALAESKAQLAVLHVTARQGADIRVDDKSVGTAPLAAPIYLDPGVHEVGAYVGANGIARPLSMQAGQESSIQLPVGAESRHEASPWSSGAPRASTRDAPSRAAAPSRSLVPVIIGGAAFVTAVTAAVIFRLESDSEFDDADALRAKLSGTGCVGSTSGDCMALAIANKNGDRARNWSTAAIVVSAAALAGTAVYWFWPASDAKTGARASNRIRLSAGVSGQGSSLLLTGNF